MQLAILNILILSCREIPLITKFRLTGLLLIIMFRSMPFLHLPVSPNVSIFIRLDCIKLGRKDVSINFRQDTINIVSFIVYNLILSSFTAQIYKKRRMDISR